MKIHVKISAKTNKLLVLSNTNEAESRCIIEYSEIETPQARIWKGETAGEWKTVVNGAVEEDITDYITTAGNKTCTLETDAKLDAKAFDAERQFLKTENLFLKQEAEKFVLCAVSKSQIEEIAEKLYPVGSIYMTVNTENPGVLFGGTWERFAQGRTLFGVIDSGSVDSNFEVPEQTGGSRNHIHATGNHALTAEEMPSHRHTVENHTHGVPNHTHSMASAGEHYHYLGIDKSAVQKGTSYNKPNNFTSGSTSYKSNTAGAHTHSINSSGACTTGGSAPNTNAVGNGAAHNHGNTESASSLPPYIAVYMWKRTA